MLHLNMVLSSSYGPVCFCADVGPCSWWDHGSDIEASFPEGIYWVWVRRTPGPVGVIRNWPHCLATWGRSCCALGGTSSHCTNVMFDSLGISSWYLTVISSQCLPYTVTDHMLNDVHHPRLIKTHVCHMCWWRTCLFWYYGSQAPWCCTVNTGLTRGFWAHEVFFLIGWSETFTPARSPSVGLWQFLLLFLLGQRSRCLLYWWMLYSNCLSPGISSMLSRLCREIQQTFCQCMTEQLDNICSLWRVHVSWYQQWPWLLWEQSEKMTRGKSDVTVKPLWRFPTNILQV